jgi:uncharacterized protein (TIGR02246 family)
MSAALAGPRYDGASKDESALQQEASMSDDERAIRDLIDSWIAASKARDLPALLDMMTDDVVFLTPGRAPFGKAQFAADSERTNGLAVDARADVQEIETFGDRAWVWTRIEAVLTASGERPRRMSGFAMSLLRKTAGRWRIARDANLVMPAQEAQP